ncbi:MAG: hypothetical protein AAF355_11505 [Myxococcota bacterium]
MLETDESAGQDIDLFRFFELTLPLFERASAARARLVGRLDVVVLLELGQTIASMCWIASVLMYGIDSGGDWLQLIAASAWLVANIAAVVSPESG